MQAKVKSIYLNHPSQGNSTNYCIILGPRDTAAPPTSQQINKFPRNRVKYLATPSSILYFLSSSSTGELCCQPIRGNVRRIGRMLPEHFERSFSDPEYSFVAVGRILRTKVRPIKNHLYSPNIPNYVREQNNVMFAQIITGLRWDRVVCFATDNGQH